LQEAIKAELLSQPKNLLLHALDGILSEKEMVGAFLSLRQLASNLNGQLTPDELGASEELFDDERTNATRVWGSAPSDPSLLQDNYSSRTRADHW